MRTSFCKPGGYVLLTMVILAIAYVIHVLFPSHYYAEAYAADYGIHKLIDDGHNPMNIIPIDRNKEKIEIRPQIPEELPDNDPGNFDTTTANSAPEAADNIKPLPSEKIQSPFRGKDNTVVANEFVKEIDPIEGSSGGKKYEPTWESLDKRPLPGWYDDVKFGIFIHWGVFSVPAFRSEWFWYRWKRQEHPAYVEFMKNNYKPGFKYTDFATDFTATFFEPKQWANLFEASGAKYVVLTSKHHEGFTNWPSKYSYGWNSVDTGPGRDLVGELAAAIKSKQGMHFGLYHSLLEWFHPLYLQDKQNDFQTQYFVESKIIPGLHELVDQYHPEVIWSDGAWEANDTYWNSTQFLAWLYNDSPVRDTVVVNDRWGRGIRCVHGGILTCKDRFNPGEVQTRKWENCMTIDRQSWGFRRNAGLQEYMTIEKLIATLVQTVSCGGNLLMNVGPTAEGRITPIYEERLRQIGSWLDVNGEAIYRTKPWKFQSDSVEKDVWYTQKKYTDIPIVYAVWLEWPKSGILQLGAPKPTPDTKLTMLGVEGDVNWTEVGSEISVELPKLNPSEIPNQWAWVLKFENLA